MLSSKNEFVQGISNFSKHSPSVKSKEPSEALSFCEFLFMSFYKENRPKQKKFYDSKKWLKLSDKYKKEHPLCERCLAAGIASVTEHVHHKIELTEETVDVPEIALNEDNLEALCFNCHQKEHHSLSEVDEALYFDENGNLRKKM
jgi:thymidine kinase